MRSNAFQCIAQPNTTLVWLHVYIVSNANTIPLWSRHFTRLCRSVHPWERVSEIQSIKETYVSWSAPSVLTEVGTNQGGDSFHFLHQLGPPLRWTGGRVYYYPVLLSWGHCLGSLLETAYSPSLSIIQCFPHNVILLLHGMSYQLSPHNDWPYWW